MNKKILLLLGLVFIILFSVSVFADNITISVLEDTMTNNRAPDYNFNSFRVLLLDARNQSFGISPRNWTRDVILRFDLTDVTSVEKVYLKYYISYCYGSKQIDDVCNQSASSDYDCTHYWNDVYPLDFYEFNDSSNFSQITWNNQWSNVTNMTPYEIIFNCSKFVEDNGWHWDWVYDAYDLFNYTKFFPYPNGNYYTFDLTDFVKSHIGGIFTFKMAIPNDYIRMDDYILNASFLWSYSKEYHGEWYDLNDSGYAYSDCSPDALSVNGMCADTYLWNSTFPSVAVPSSLEILGLMTPATANVTIFVDVSQFVTPFTIVTDNNTLVEEYSGGNKTISLVLDLYHVYSVNVTGNQIYPFFGYFNATDGETFTATPTSSLSGTGDLITDIGSGVGGFMSAIYLPLGTLILYLAIITGVMTMIFAIAYVIGRFMSKEK